MLKDVWTIYKDNGRLEVVIHAIKPKYCGGKWQRRCESSKRCIEETIDVVTYRSEYGNVPQLRICYDCDVRDRALREV